MESVSGRARSLLPLPITCSSNCLGVHRRDRQRDRFSDPQSVGVNEREAAAVNGLLQRGDQAATIVIGADVGQSDVAWLAHFFFVNNGHW